MKPEKLNEKQLLYLSEHLSDISDLSESDEDPYAASDDDSNYEPSTGDDIENIENEGIMQYGEQEMNDAEDEDENTVNDLRDEEQGEAHDVLWKDPGNNFIPRKQIPAEVDGFVILDINRSSSELEVFLKLFPRSLLLHIADCTNKRLNQLNKNVPKTDLNEIILVLGCTLVMSYNRVPEFSHYWSSNESLANPIIKRAISRDRCTLILSKMYYTDPQKPDGCSKVYYVEDLVSCLKFTFLRARTESSHQSIDETMTKFKGRSSLKQYLPLKPIKRGIKLWQRCDAKTGYVYDFNIYCGKELESEGTLGERVITKLTSTIRSPNVCICFDRFFTSVHLMDHLPFACVGTYMKTRKNTPNFPNEKTDRGSASFLANGNGTLATKWKDTKDVFIMSNCHSNKITITARTLKNGQKAEIPCPEAVIFYNKFMGGVDLADQKTSTYDLDRKSAKWWRKVFYKLLMTAVVNSWIIFQQVHHKKVPLITYLVPLAEQMIEIGRLKASVKRRLSGKSGPRPKRQKSMTNVGDHLPTEGTTRRRCHRCSLQKQEKRTKTVCISCNIPLCKNCFLPYHS